jgi:hypothetical protein
MCKKELAKKLDIWVYDGKNVTVTTFTNCSYVINNNFIIVTTKTDDESFMNKIFSLNDVTAYKVNNNK